MDAPVITFPITDLNQLFIVADEYFARVFMENLTKVFQYQTNDINKILNAKLPKVLKYLREVLLDKAATDIQQFQGNTPKVLGKKSKPLIMEDIIILGKVLTRSMEHNALEYLFRSENSTSHEQDQVNLLKTELDKIKNENESLKLENNELKIKLSNCQAALGISTELLNQSESNAPGESKNEKPNTVPLVAAPPKSTPAPVKAAKINAPEKTFALIRNIHPECSRMSMLNYFKEKLNMDISLSDIFELPKRKCDNRDYKISVPVNSLNHVLSNWPEGVIAEPYIEKNNMNRPRSYKDMSTHRGNSERGKFRDHSSNFKYNSTPDSQSQYYHNSFPGYSSY